MDSNASNYYGSTDDAHDDVTAQLTLGAIYWGFLAGTAVSYICVQS